MNDNRKRNEFWHYLVAEKNQPRPKGITMQRLAVIKPIILGSERIWSQVIGQYGAAERAAEEFYRSNDPAAVLSRTAFWDAVRLVIRQTEKPPSATGQRSVRPDTKTWRKPQPRSRKKSS